jgi:hypothetical protein
MKVYRQFQTAMHSTNNLTLRLIFGASAVRARVVAPRTMYKEITRSLVHYSWHIVCSLTCCVLSAALRRLHARRSHLSRIPVSTKTTLETLGVQASSADAGDVECAIIKTELRLKKVKCLYLLSFIFLLCYFMCFHIKLKNYYMYQIFTRFILNFSSIPFLWFRKIFYNSLEAFKIPIG